MSSANTASSVKTELGNLPEWNLNDLYPGMQSVEFKLDFDAAVPDAQGFEAQYKDKLAALSGDELAEALAAYEQLEERLGRVISYAGLIYAGDSSDPANAKFYGDVQERLTMAGGHLLFFGLELNAIKEAHMEKALAGSAALAHYRPWLTDLRLDKPYQLDAKLEQLFLEKSSTGAGAFNRLFDETMSALRFDVKGEELAIEPTLNLLQDKDGTMRKAASDALAKTFGDNIRLFTLITNTLAKDKQIGDTWRGFEDVADGRHLANRVERQVVGALVDAVEDAFPRISHRYYAMKAKWMGMDQLNHWDRNAPLPIASTRSIKWDEARDTVLDAYRGFAPEMATIAADFFDHNWIDAPVRPGKSPGAFAHPTVPSAHPYVLLNYQGKPRDVMTLAHELGHGVHQVLAGRQGALMASTPLTLAETASVFGEMLTFRSLLEQAKSPTERKAMLAAKVEDMINTVVRQIAFYMFERKVHEERRNGELTTDQINAAWMSVQESSLGPSVKLGEGYERFWTYVPHFIHSPFYVYAYAFGDCLVNSLYAVYQNAEDGFQDKYFEMLKAGGTKHHSELLAPFGLDASDPAFWGKGLAVIEGLIDELEALDAA
ncbi:M3 family oligoendopeptidase [Ahrensia sp. R2A130]|uniref:M3 family oligoendopeptidase n=1 Tax=Ahrensia sp. R2A130 TaxID=744979 RepID=UPI0001E0ACA0|nr:M3 family oligoendopeptidase [Ahrensia sp. R2A130]EFL88655.1 PepF/M3 family oligoendopeptidase [Ahrensia sp. R2A130]